MRWAQLGLGASSDDAARDLLSFFLVAMCFRIRANFDDPRTFPGLITASTTVKKTRVPRFRGSVWRKSPIRSLKISCHVSGGKINRVSLVAQHPRQPKSPEIPPVSCVPLLGWWCSYCPQFSHAWVSSNQSSLVAVSFQPCFRVFRFSLGCRHDPHTTADVPWSRAEEYLRAAATIMTFGVGCRGTCEPLGSRWGRMWLVAGLVVLGDTSENATGESSLRDCHFRTENPAWLACTCEKLESRVALDSIPARPEDAASRFWWQRSCEHAASCAKVGAVAILRTHFFGERLRWSASTPLPQLSPG